MDSIKPPFFVLISCCIVPSAFSFEGRINATLTRGGEVQTLHYTVGTNQMRIERGESDHPHACDVINLDTGAIMILFPHNRSFVRLKNESVARVPSRVPADAPSSGFGLETRPIAPGAGALPNSAPMIGPTNLPGMPPIPAGIGPQTAAGPGTPSMPGMPAMPMMPMPMEPIELKATGQTTNLLGYACMRYEIKQRGEAMEIWATDKLLPFRPYLPNQPHRFGPGMIEEQWAELLAAKKLFPLRASLHFENGPERFHFEVQSITPQKLKEADMKLFQPPDGYFEIQPLPF